MTEDQRDQILLLVSAVRAQNERIVAYGAPAVSVNDFLNGTTALVNAIENLLLYHVEVTP